MIAIVRCITQIRCFLFADGTKTSHSTPMAKLTKQCIANSAEESIIVRRVERKKSKWADKNSPTCTIERWKEALGIPHAVDIKKETVRSSAKRFNPRVLKEAVTSPMLKVEPYIVELIDQLSKIRLPITCRKGLQLANSLISGKSVLKSVEQWRKRYCISFRDQEDGLKDTKGLGMGYWRGLWKGMVTTKSRERREWNSIVSGLTGVHIQTPNWCITRHTRKW